METNLWYNQIQTELNKFSVMMEVCTFFVHQREVNAKMKASKPLAPCGLQGKQV